MNVKSMTLQDAVPTSLVDPAARQTPEWQFYRLFRLALCAEFVGHGAFGVLTKQAWAPYFTRFGFLAAWAWHLMPVVGSVESPWGCWRSSPQRAPGCCPWAVGASSRRCGRSRAKGAGSSWTNMATTDSVGEVPKAVLQTGCDGLRDCGHPCLTRTPLASEIGHRDLLNRVTTSLTLVGHAADSPATAPQAVTGHRP
jgi:hypothetical protein